MLCRTWLVRMAAAAGCAALLPEVSRAEETPPRVEIRRLVIRRDGPPMTHRLVQAEAEGRRGPGVVIGTHWLGLECFPLDAALRSHLGLAENEGLIIEQIVPDSPAAKADLKQHDVIVKAGSVTIKSLSDLMKAVDEAKDKEMPLDILRGAKQMVIKITPAMRPQREDVLRRVPEPPDELRQWMERLNRGDQRGPFRYRIFGPGAVLPGVEASLPKGMRINIDRSEDAPAKIKVQRGEETWEITEKELDKLPEEVRPHVERMLGRGAMAGMPALPGGMPPMARPEARGPDGGFEKQLEQLMDQLRKMQRQMDELQKNLPRESKPESEESRA